ncbi:MAG: L-histidine N(alpha)-methyltransferase [Proteobacteria bacterium]|nr:L-histidine N(alpha)-methyltransferase [Pseudomonadota bacterium]
MNGTAFDPTFAKHVLEGLSRPEKFLPSRYFYDARGDRLFQSIMASPEYYLTDCELEIFETQGDELARALMTDRSCELIELGSGDGLKTSLLLDALHEHHQDWVYRPVDISDNSLDLLEQRLVPDRPWLDFQAIHADYMDLLREFEPGGIRRVFMFLGSNLGNYTSRQAITFLRLIHVAMAPGDALLVGLDLKKDPDVIRAAYNDAAGYTRDFNLNLLARINRELGGDFNLDSFEHVPVYDLASGTARSSLRSRVEQNVRVAALDRVFHFHQGEAIHMEISQKYDEALIGELTSASGFIVDQVFTDSRNYFTDQVWVYG